MMRDKLTTTNDAKTFALVAACFALSGFAALLYQTAWLRQLSIVFGTSELALVAVLAAYMGGLAVGALLAGHLIERIQRPIVVYGLLEAGIAAAALAIPLLLSAAQILYVSLFGVSTGLPSVSVIQGSLFYLMISFLVLLPPTALMGATLPLLTKYVVKTNDHVGSRSAILYAINTLGAVFGTLFAAFIFLPNVGLNGTIGFGVLVNVSVFFIALFVHQIASKQPAGIGQEPSASNDAHQTSAVVTDLNSALERSRNNIWILPIIAASGMTSFAYEVLWTRLLGHVLGGSIYAFATMLASFLMGIALGSAVASRLCRSIEQAATGMVIAQLGIALTSLFIYTVIDSLIPSQFTVISGAFFAAAILTPAAFFIGTTFPFAIRILTPHPALAGKQSARIYTWNTTGAIVGAVGAGYIGIPALGFSGSIQALVLVNACLAVSCAVIFSQDKRIFVPLSAASLLAVLVLFEPHRPDALINASRLDPASHRDFQSQERELFYAVGHSATVLLKEKSGQFILKTNGLPEAIISPKGRVPKLHPQHWLTLLPSLAKPDAESMLVIGFGGGVALESIPPHIKRIDVVELESQVITANATISELRDIDPLADERLNVVVNDARGLLNLTENTYDIIVSQPSHPWTAGASHLYTLEFIELAKKRLSENGVFLQWINWNFLDEALLRSMAATLQSKFKNVRVYQHSPSVLHFLASDESLAIEASVKGIHFSTDNELRFYEQFGALSAEDIAYALTLDEAGTAKLAQSAALTTDNFNRLAFLANTASADSSRKENPEAELLSVLAPYLVYNNDASNLMSANNDALSKSRVAQRMLSLGFVEQVRFLASATTNEVDRLVIESMIHRQLGEHQQMYTALWRAYDLEPNSETVQFALIRNQLGSIARGQADESIQQIANQSSGIIKAIIEGWRYASQSRWSNIAALEERLSSAKPSDLWFAEASQLRAQWRLQAKSLNWLRPHDKEAIKIADQALAIGYNFDLMLIRLAASAKLNDQSSVLVSANMVAEHIQSKLVAAEQDRYQFDGSSLGNHVRQIDYIGALLARESFSAEQSFNKNALLTQLAKLRTDLDVLRANLRP